MAEQHIGHNIGPDEANKKLNIGAAMYGFADPAFRDEPVDDPSDGYTSEQFGDGWEQLPAPSTGKRRRAKWIGYHRGMKMLIVVFTYEPRKKANPGKQISAGNTQPWVRYEEVDLEMWDELAGYHSTGEWLKFSGVENGNYYRTRPDEIEDLTEAYKDSLRNR
jgi:hypothetical protein